MTKPNSSVSENTKDDPMIVEAEKDENAVRRPSAPVVPREITKPNASTPEHTKDDPMIVEAEKDENAVRRPSAPVVPRMCPYLDTIDRSSLDFDLTKQCSVSLKKQNVYMCLVCGHMFHGRGPGTHAYTHSVQCGHHVFVHCDTVRFYCLPENYEIVNDASLIDVSAAMRPRFGPSDIARLDANNALSKNAQGVQYLPGFVGMNNLKCTDFINTVVHALAHVRPLRDYFLEPKNYVGTTTDPVVLRFGELVRKIWSGSSFKNCVAPHEFVHEVAMASNSRFKVEKRSLVTDFLPWLLQRLHRGLARKTKKKRKASSVIQSVFKGQVEVKSHPLVVRKSEGDAEDVVEALTEDETVERVPFLFLSLDLPPMPLFKDAEAGNVIPSEPLPSVLRKFDGTRPTDHLAKKMRRFYTITRLPEYLILCLKRFSKNNFFIEKNTTIVNFPIKNLDMRDYLTEQGHKTRTYPSAEELRAMKVQRLRAILDRLKVRHDDVVEKSELVQRAARAVERLKKRHTTKYDLVANIVHDSPAETSGGASEDPVGDGRYRVDVYHPASDQWYDIEDLRAKEVMPQVISVSESNVLIYRRQGS